MSSDAQSDTAAADSPAQPGAATPPSGGKRAAAAAAPESSDLVAATKAGGRTKKEQQAETPAAATEPADGGVQTPEQLAELLAADKSEARNVISWRVPHSPPPSGELFDGVPPRPEMWQGRNSETCVLLSENGRRARAAPVPSAPFTATHNAP